jgi:hypothetical protein
VPSGWDLDNLTCIDPSGGTTTNIPSATASIDLLLGEHVECTYENSAEGTIVIIKNSIPDDSQVFDYAGTLATFTLVDDGSPPGNIITFTRLVGTYDVTETVPNGWDLTDLDCVDDLSIIDSSGDKGTGVATINLDLNETVTCTYTNTKRGTVVIAKDAIPDSSQVFDYAGTLGTFTLVDSGGNGNIITFVDLLPGTYDVTETVPTGWDLTGLICTDPSGGTSTSNGTATIGLAAGETVRCDYENTERGNVVIAKNAIPDSSQVFDYAGTLATFTLVDDGGSGNIITFERVPGIYGVTETVPSGWALTGLICTDPSGGTSTSNGTATIDLAPGETVRCDYENTEAGIVVIAKNAIPDGSQVFDYAGTLATFTLVDDGGSGNIQTFIREPGIYGVTETVPSGWDLTGLICTDPSGGTGTSGATATIDLAPGETVRCDYENTERGTVVIAKNAIPDSSQVFDYAGTLATFTLVDSGGNGNIITFERVPGIYGVTETVPSGWDLTGLICTDPSGGTSTSGGTATIDLAPGETVRCDYENTERGNVVIAKNAIPDSTQVFDYAGTLATFTLVDDGGSGNIITFERVPGIYGVTETVPSGWELTGLICTDPSGGTSTSGATATIDLAPGETVRCDYENTEAGTIVIAKNAIPDSTQVFDYAGTLATFTLVDDGGSGNIITFERAPGTYTVTETVPAGWDLTGLICTDPSSGTSTSNGTATIDLAPGETVRCDYENTERGTVVIAKNAIPDSSQVFDYAGTLATFTLIDDGGSGNIITFERVPGIYGVTETVPSGWDLTGLICTDPSGGTSTSGGTATIDLAPGETVRCDYENTERGNVVIAKNAIPDSSQVFDYAGTLATFTLVDDGGSGNIQTFERVPGIYGVTETVPSGWDLTGLICTDPSGGTSTSGATATIDLAPGETVRCDYENTERGRIIVIKDAIPDSTQVFDYSSTLGSFTLVDTGGNGNIITFDSLTPGNYPITEVNVPSGWTLQSIVCDDANSIESVPTATVILEAGETVTCTFTNVMIAEGCTPGFWKNHEELWALLTGGNVAIDDKFTDFFTNIFVVDPATVNTEMLEALALPGGPENALTRHAAAALLNAYAAQEGFLTAFPFTPAEVIADYQAAFAAGANTTIFNDVKAAFVNANEQICPSFPKLPSFSFFF